LIALGVLVQAADVALGWFTAIHDLDNGLVIDENYDGNAGHMLHGFVGLDVIPALGLILLVVLILLQVTLAFIAFGVPIVGALHGLNALAVLGAAVRAMMLTRDDGGTRRDSRGGAADVPRQSTGSSVPEASRPVN
jgi:hypothetical protein